MNNVKINDNDERMSKMDYMSETGLGNGLYGRDEHDGMVGDGLDRIARDGQGSIGSSWHSCHAWDLSLSFNPMCRHLPTMRTCVQYSYLSTSMCVRSLWRKCPIKPTEVQ